MYSRVRHFAKMWKLLLCVHDIRRNPTLLLLPDITPVRSGRRSPWIYPKHTDRFLDHNTTQADI